MTKPFEYTIRRFEKAAVKFSWRGIYSPEERDAITIAYREERERLRQRLITMADQIDLLTRRDINQRAQP